MAIPLHSHRRLYGFRLHKVAACLHEHEKANEPDWRGSFRFTMSQNTERNNHDSLASKELVLSSSGPTRPRPRKHFLPRNDRLPNAEAKISEFWREKLLIGWIWGKAVIWTGWRLEHVIRSNWRADEPLSYASTGLRWSQCRCYWNDKGRSFRFLQKPVVHHVTDVAEIPTNHLGIKTRHFNIRTFKIETSWLVIS